MKNERRIEIHPYTIMAYKETTNNCKVEIRDSKINLVSKFFWINVTLNINHK